MIRSLLLLYNQQVYFARVRATGQPVAVKVQRPGALSTISKDLYVMRRGVGVYEQLVKRFTAQTTDYQQLLSTFAEGLYTEMDFRNEVRACVCVWVVSWCPCAACRWHVLEASSARMGINNNSMHTCGRWRQAVTPANSARSTRHQGAPELSSAMSSDLCAGCVRPAGPECHEDAGGAC